MGPPRLRSSRKWLRECGGLLWGSGVCQAGQPAEGRSSGDLVFADFGAHAHQVGTGGLGIAFAKHQLITRLGQVSHGHAEALGVQADEVAHPHIGPQLPTAAGRVRWAAGSAPAQRLRVRGPAAAWGLIEGDVQIGQQHIQCGLAVQRVSTRLRSSSVTVWAGPMGVQPWVARQQSHPLAEGHAAEAAFKHPACRPLPWQGTPAAVRKLHGAPQAGRRQAAEHLARGGALGQFGHQLGHIGVPASACTRAVAATNPPPAALGKAAGKGHATEHPVLVGRHVQQHHGQGPVR